MSATGHRFGGIDGIVARYVSDLRGIETRLKATETLAELRRLSDPPLSPGAAALRALAGFVLLIGPVVAFAILVVRKALPLDIALAVSGIIMIVAAAISAIVTIVAFVAVRYVSFKMNYLIGTAVVAALVAVLALWLPTVSPSQAGRDAAGWTFVMVVCSLVIILSAAVVVTKGFARMREVERATRDIRSKAEQILRELGQVRDDTLSTLGGLDASPGSNEALTDRNAALLVLVKRYLLTAADAEPLQAMPLGALQLAPPYLAITEGGRA